MRVAKSRTRLSNFHFTSGKICIEGCLLDVATMKLLMTLAWTLFKINFYWNIAVLRASQVAQLVKNPPANAGDPGDMGSIPGLGRSPGGGRGNPFQYSCLGNFMNRGAWRATVHGVTESQTQLRDLACTHTKSYKCLYQRKKRGC